ncbi:extended synaptotagmin-1 [Brachionus plicatilis]|uniref:Extended synaptotagmin-1 n=1 Tax=Brachionus plicatilis TaxID=10195 RepID=A0A3M7P621_BRAPC|nr:extended synaptotagmin-1 [Brachionus plicatilis]
MQESLRKPEKKSKKKSRAIKDELSPVFNDIFHWNINFGELKRRQICITVKNDKPMLTSEKTFMGQLWIDLTNLEPNVRIDKWYDLRDEKDAKFSFNY